MQDALVLLFTQEQYCVLSAASGEGALARIEEEHFLPQVLLLDYQIAGQMTGIELYDQLHARPGWEQVPAIVMSAYLPEKEIAARHLIGLAKPFDLDVLLTQVAVAVTGRSECCEHTNMREPDASAQPVSVGRCDPDQPWVFLTYLPS